MKERIYCISKISQIGIPRALSFYHNFLFYLGFFNALGIEVVLSDPTSTKTINVGSKYVAAETCLPIKVFVGHVVNLLDKGVTNIFVPSLQSTAYKINNCSKIRGLPEIIRNVIDRPLHMIEPTLDKTEGLGFREFWNDVAEQVGVLDKNLVEQAIEEGRERYDNFFEMTKAGLPYRHAFENALNNVYERKYIRPVKPLSVVLMAHGYNLFDERISFNLIKKLEKMNIEVYTSLNVSKENAKNALLELNEIQYWANELELTGVAAHFLNNTKIDGIISLSAFGCGPDSLMVDEIAYHAKKKNVPMLNLVVDEHTGELGFITRLEAFVDMLTRKKIKQVSQKQVEEKVQKLEYKVFEKV